MIHIIKEGETGHQGLNIYRVRGGFGGIVFRLIIGRHCWRLRIRNPSLCGPFAIIAEEDLPNWPGIKSVPLFLFGHWVRDVEA
jgi:hypothetical protein